MDDQEKASPLGGASDEENASVGEIHINIKKTGPDGCGHVSVTLWDACGNQVTHVSLVPSNPACEFITVAGFGQIPVGAFNESNATEDHLQADQVYSIPLTPQKFVLTEKIMREQIDQIESGQIMYALGASSSLGTYFPLFFIGLAEHTSAGLKQRFNMKMGKPMVEARSTSPTESLFLIHNCVSVSASLLETVFSDVRFSGEGAFMPHELGERLKEFNTSGKIQMSFHDVVKNKLLQVEATREAEFNASFRNQ